MRLFIFLLCLQSAALGAAPRVVTSIAPLQEICAEIMAGIAEPVAIIGQNASAHHFAFKPSHLRQLQQADLVIWIERHFEAGFYRVTDILPASTHALELIPALGLETEDGHIWYSPQLLLRIIEAITVALIELDPEHQPQYRQNAQRLSTEIAAWRGERMSEWQQRRPRFITDHAFTTHFEADLGLVAIATIHDQHDAHGGLKKLQQLESLLRQKPAACLLTLEHQPSGIAKNLSQKNGLRIINLSAQGEPDPRQPAIIRRLEQLNNALLTCL